VSTEISYTPYSATESTVSVSPSTVIANNVASATVLVTLRDLYGNPVVGKDVSLSSNRGALDNITKVGYGTDANGVATFTVTSSAAGVSTFTATVMSDNGTLPQTVVVTFTGPSVTIDSVQNPNNSYTFTAVVTGGTSPYTYLWSGDCSGTKETAKTGNSAGNYTCTVTVTDLDGATGTATINTTITAPVKGKGNRK